MIQTLPAPCWHLTETTGSEFDTGDGTPHFDTQADANKAADDEAGIRTRNGINDRPLTPRQFDRTCTIVTCTGCGDTMGDDAWGTVHFDDEKSARDGISFLDWDDDGIRCPTCVDVASEAPDA